MTPLQLTLVSLRRIIRTTESDSRDLAKQAKMATSELLTLQAIQDTPGISPGSLAKSMSLSPVTSTVILQKLEQRGLVQKVRSESDRRKIEVQLTESGRMELEAAPSSLQEKFEQNFNRLPEWEQLMIAASVSKITHLLGAENLDASPILTVGPIGQSQ